MELAIENTRFKPISIELATWIRRGCVAGLVGLLIFAHGCHGPDEDHELFARQDRAGFRNGGAADNRNR